jgi:small-conductance mechanosensitive channel
VVGHVTRFFVPRIRIPNCEIYGKVIENWTRNHFIRIEIPITTATCHPIERVKEVIEEALDPYR